MVKFNDFNVRSLIFIIVVESVTNFYFLIFISNDFPTIHGCKFSMISLVKESYTIKRSVQKNIWTFYFMLVGEVE